MNKLNIKMDVLKKIIRRLVKAAPARAPEKREPLGQLVRAFLEYDCDLARADSAEKKFQANMVDMNDLRVTPAIELAALLGVRYPFAESRCSGLHRTLQSIFDREHHMKLDRMQEMKKSEIRPYLQSLAGITPYTEASVALECFDAPAVPIDTKLLLWLIAKDALPENTDLRAAQHILEKQIKPTQISDFHHGARREIDDWVPKAWPPVAKVYSPMLAPPALNAKGEEILIPQDPVPMTPKPPGEVKPAKKSGKRGGEAKKATAAPKEAPKPAKPAEPHKPAPPAKAAVKVPAKPAPAKKK